MTWQLRTRFLDAFEAFHKDKGLVQKYLNSLLIGELAPNQPSCEPTKNERLVQDFRELRSKVKKMGLLKSRFAFFTFMFLHAFLLDVTSWLTIWYFGKSWVPFLIGGAFFTIAQIQYGFLQHDFGHVSVFQKPKWNRLAHTFVMGILKDMAIVLFYSVHVCLMYVPLMGFKGFMAYYWLARLLEVTCFLWVTQMSHIPMTINYDQNLDWVSAQLSATCNVDRSWFNDWFTGHLNFQIEHHLFPTMPRHNYCKVAPLVRSLCAKHGVQYECKPLLTAFADILRSLKESGRHWQEAYLHALGEEGTQTTEIN